MFKDIFNKDYESKFFSPGRINILGEHIDYNGGHCLPMAIDKGTYAYVAKNNLNKFRIFSENFSAQGVYEIGFNDEHVNKKANGWSNLFIGMLVVLKEKLGHIPFGLDIYFNGEIPTASGLSSSASLSMLIGRILNEYYDLKLSTLDLVFLTQRMENEFLGAQTGILDQYAIGNGKKDYAMLLDASVPSHDLYPSDFGDNVFLIISTNKTRELAESKYNERVYECRAAKDILNQNGFNIKHLCELKLDDLPRIEEIIKESNLLKRVQHCVTEEYRTKAAAAALKDSRELGRLLYEGHESMRDLYEATGQHLDFIYDFAKTKPYVLGARMNGAGFGGSGITLLPKSKVDEYMKEFRNAYFDRFNIEPTFIVAVSADGTRKC